MLSGRENQPKENNQHDRTPDITPGVRTRQLLDDLLWLRTGVVWDRQDAVDKMLEQCLKSVDRPGKGRTFPGDRLKVPS